MSMGPNMASPALSWLLASEGVQDLEAMLCGSLGIRTRHILCSFSDDELKDVCDHLRFVGFGPGHTCALRHLHSSSLVMPEGMQSKLLNTVYMAHKQLHAAIAAMSDARLQEAVTHLDQIAASLVREPDCTAARALDLVREATHHALNQSTTMQNNMHDIVVLCCSRVVNPRDYAAMRRSFATAFARDIDNQLMSELFNSRYQLFGIRGWCGGRCVPRRRKHKPICRPPDSSDGTVSATLEGEGATSRAANSSNPGPDGLERDDSSATALWALVMREGSGMLHIACPPPPPYPIPPSPSTIPIPLPLARRQR